MSIHGGPSKDERPRQRQDYLVMVKEKVLLIDLIPEGAVALMVTKALLMRIPTRDRFWGILMAAVPCPLPSRVPLYLEKMEGNVPEMEMNIRASGLSPNVRVSIGIGPVPSEEAT